MATWTAGLDTLLHDESLVYLGLFLAALMIGRFVAGVRLFAAPMGAAARSPIRASSSST